MYIQVVCLWLRPSKDLVIGVRDTLGSLQEGEKPGVKEVDIVLRLSDAVGLRLYFTLICLII